MGLDMYLEGRTYFFKDWDKMKEGYRVKGEILDLGYWRKHPNLHGYIVQNFAEGVDKCQEINLSEEKMEQLIRAVEERALPKTTGFFFGESDGSERESDLKTLNAALKWLRKESKRIGREIVYQASW